MYEVSDSYVLITFHFYRYLYVYARLNAILYTVSPSLSLSCTKETCAYISQKWKCLVIKVYQTFFKALESSYTIHKRKGFVHP